MKGNNNHEEADTLIMHCLKLVELGPSENVYIYATDTDIICLLIIFFNESQCKNIYVGTKRGETTDVKTLQKILGDKRSIDLIAFHCITGCDTVGKFRGISK